LPCPFWYGTSSKWTIWISCNLGPSILHIVSSTWVEERLPQLVAILGCPVASAAWDCRGRQMINYGSLSLHKSYYNPSLGDEKRRRPIFLAVFASVLLHWRRRKSIDCGSSAQLLLFSLRFVRFSWITVSSFVQYSINNFTSDQLQMLVFFFQEGSFYHNHWSRLFPQLILCNRSAIVGSGISTKAHVLKAWSLAYNALGRWWNLLEGDTTGRL
jgi:hypothetical protein